MPATPITPAAETDAETPFAVLESTRLDGAARFLNPHRVRIAVDVRGVEKTEITRECTYGGEAVSILPYDPETNKVLVVKEPLAGALLSGQQNFLGLISGRVDPGENPIQAAQRELREEAGVEIPLKRLQTVAGPMMIAASVTTAVHTLFYAPIKIGDVPDLGKWRKGHGDEILRPVAMDAKDFIEKSQSAAPDKGVIWVMAAMWLRLNMLYLGLQR